jgi:hypothetical protein
MQVSSNNSWISPAMMSSPGVAPGETTTGSGNVGSNDGARNAVGLFHIVVVSLAPFRKLGRAMKGDHGEPHVPRLGFSVYFKEDGQAENQRLGTERISSNALLNLLEVGPDPVTPAEGGKTLTFSAVSSLFLAAGALNSP